MARNSLLKKFRKRSAILFPHKKVERDGIKYDLDCRELIDYRIYLEGWEPDTIRILKENIKPGMTILEVGANVGAHTLIIAQQTGPAGKVHAIEPTDFAMNKLKKSLDLNPDLIPRIELYDCLIADFCEDNFQDQIKSSWTWRKSHKDRDEEIVHSRAITIDRLVKEAEIKKVDFLKIDIDGYDFMALLGANETLTNHRPQIYIELCNWALEKHGHHSRDIVEYLEKFGYKGISEEETPRSIDKAFTEDVIGDQGSVNALFHYEPN